jgi:hypothetical protein
MDGAFHPRKEVVGEAVRLDRAKRADYNSDITQLRATLQAAGQMPLDLGAKLRLKASLCVLRESLSVFPAVSAEAHYKT